MPEEATTQTELLRSPGFAQQLAPFFLLSLLLHVALLFVIHPPTRNVSITQSQPMEVRFSAPLVSKQTRVLDRAPTGEHRKPGQTEIPSSGTHGFFNSQQLMESAKNMARDEARTTEQHTAVQEQKKLNTPVGLLEQYLKQPYKEIRLANGTLKIVTDTGAICFQPVPYFAQDSAGVFGIPTTCP